MAKTAKDTVHVTREELEDIWHRKPYGEIDRLIKQRKGMKKFIVTTELRKLVVVDQEVREVWAKDSSAANMKVHEESRLKLQLRGGYSRWDDTVTYSTKSVQA